MSRLVDVWNRIEGRYEEETWRNVCLLIEKPENKILKEFKNKKLDEFILPISVKFKFRESYIKKWDSIKLISHAVNLTKQMGNPLDSENIKKNLTTIYCLTSYQDEINLLFSTLHIEHQCGFLNVGPDLSGNFEGLEKDLLKGISTREKLNSLENVVICFEENTPAWSGRLNKLMSSLKVLFDEKYISDPAVEIDVKEMEILAIDDKATILDDILFLSTINSVSESRGCLSRYDARYLITEVLKLNGSRDVQYRYFHLGFYDGLFDEDYSNDFPERNNARIISYTYGYLTALARRSETERILSFYADNKQLTLSLIQQFHEKRYGVNIASQLLDIMLQRNRHNEIDNILSVVKNITTLSVDSRSIKDIILTKVQDHLSKNKFNEALGLLKYQDEDEDFLRIKSKIYLGTGMFSKAVTCYRKLIQEMNSTNVDDYIGFTLAQNGFENIAALPLPLDETELQNEIILKIRPLLVSVQRLGGIEINASYVYLKTFHDALVNDEQSQGVECISVLDSLKEDLENTYSKFYISSKILILEALIYSEALNESYFQNCYAKISEYFIKNEGLDVPVFIWRKIITALSLSESNTYYIKVYEIISKKMTNGAQPVLCCFDPEILSSNECFVRNQVINWSGQSNDNKEAWMLNGLGLIRNHFSYFPDVLKSVYFQIEDCLDANISNLCIEEIIFGFDPQIVQVLGETILAPSYQRTMRRIRLMLMNQEHYLRAIIDEYDSYIRYTIEQNDCNRIELNEIIEERNLLIADNEFANENFQQFPIVHDEGKHENEFRALINGRDKIRIAWFGGGDHQRKGVEKMQEYFQTNFPDIFEFKVHLVYLKNGGSGWGKEVDYKAWVDQSDFVVIHTATRTNYGGTIRSLASKYLCLGVRTTNEDVFINKIKQGCFLYLGIQSLKKAS